MRVYRFADILRHWRLSSVWIIKICFKEGIFEDKRKNQKRTMNVTWSPDLHASPRRGQCHGFDVEALTLNDTKAT